MRAAPWTDPSAVLASGDADVAPLRLPFPGQDVLRVEVLFAEPRWVVLPAHPVVQDFVRSCLEATRGAGPTAGGAVVPGG